MTADPAEATAAGLTATETGAALDYLLSHRKLFTQQFLRDQNLPYSGTRQELRERLLDGLEEGRLAPDDILGLLDRIEGWGNQHIYLYRSEGRATKHWLTPESAKSRLAAGGLAHLLNRPRPLVLPDQPTLSTVIWEPDRVRFLWVERCCWEERTPAQDRRKGVVVWRAYKTQQSRGLVSFDWDLLTGDAMLMIQRLPSGSDYGEKRDQFQTALDPIVDFGRFTPVRTSRAIQPIQRSGEVRSRQVSFQTRQGGKAALTSAGPVHGITADPDLEQIEQSLRNSVAGLLGSFYWLPAAGKLSREVHCKLYADDQRVGIFGEHQEHEVRYVLSRIRHYCS